MEIGFVSFNQEALNRANKVMKLLQGQGAIDELGLGRIRDAFSNMMFPGMSVLQTHAKYFLLLPALYVYLEKTSIADAREARTVVRDQEIKMTNRLMEGSSKDTTGIIGGDMLSRGEGYVKYDPSYVYQAGMEMYGLIPSDVNIYATLAERSAIYQNNPKKHKGNEEIDGDSDDLIGNRQIFKVCGEDYDFSHNEPLNIKLTSVEAGFLKTQIIRNTQKSLLSYLLDSGLYENITDYLFDELGEILQIKVPYDLYRIYKLALRFSRFAYLLRVRYAMLYDIAVGANDAAIEELQRFDSTLLEFRHEFTPEAIDEIVQIVSSRVSEESCKAFIVKSARLITEGNYDELDRQITLREKTIKGLKRSKLVNANDFEKGKAFESPAMMSYRWNTIVRTVLSEINEGLKSEY